MKTAEVHQMPVRSATVWPLSVEAYHALGEARLMPEQTELLYGFVYRKMSKSPLHSLLMLRLLRLLQQTLPHGLHSRPEQPLTCGDSEPEPDLAVVAGSEDAFGLAHPCTAELVIEVCVSSPEFDRSKLRAYANASVKECWLILAPEKQVAVYRQPAGDQFAAQAVYGPGGSVTSTAVPGFTVELDALFAIQP